MVLSLSKLTGARAAVLQTGNQPELNVRCPRALTMDLQKFPSASTCADRTARMLAAVGVSGDSAVDVKPSMSLKIAADVKPATAALSASELSLVSAAQMTVEPAVDVTLSVDAADMDPVLYAIAVPSASALFVASTARMPLDPVWNGT